MHTRPSITRVISVTISLIAALSGIPACTGNDGDGKVPGFDDGGGEVVVDADGDGVAEDDDCDDADSSIYPGADERCDGVDDDCDELIDEEDAIDTRPYFRDADGDGYGDTDSLSAACEAPIGHVPVSGDCDDDDNTVYPDAPERCDGIDQDCDADIDEGAADLWFQDLDADGYGDPTTGLETCDPGEGYVTDGSDCDDTEPTAFPGAAERCDGLDNDCDGGVDEEGRSPWYRDLDDDGYGDPEAEQVDCAAPEGFVADNTDCDDSLATVSPVGVELCDGLDDDCDGSIDEPEAVDATTWYTDGDLDGWGEPSSASVSCEGPTGSVSLGGDCDDIEAAVSPAAIEQCDLIDNNCDGDIDEDAASDAPLWYQDTDIDGFGDPTTAAPACTQPGGTVADDQDCDDNDADISPADPERCNLVDDDCDLDIDEPEAIDASTFYEDQDADGYGGLSLTVGCSAPTGSVATGGDCEDDDPEVSPGLPEVCDDGKDNTCDGTDDGCLLDGSLAVALSLSILEGQGSFDRLSSALLLADLDGDGVGDAIAGSRTDDDGGSGSGAAFFFAGPLSGTLSAAAAVSFAGEDAGDAAGSALDAGDVDGDGFLDLLVGAPDSDSTGSQAGSAYLLRGPLSADLDLSLADIRLRGEDASDQAGASVSLSGDLDGDGAAELLIGAPFEDAPGASGGSVYLFSTPAAGEIGLLSADTRLLAESGGDEAGTALCSRGDIDGDGLHDLLIGAPSEDSAASNAGAVYLLSLPGSGTLTLASADAKLQGAAKNDAFGASVASVGDTDSDGYDDLLVGAPEEDSAGSDAGAVYLFRGPPSGTLAASSATATFLGEAAGDLAGSAVAGAGDVNGDGAVDLLIGGPGASGDDGLVWLLYGPESGSLSLSAADVTFEGEAGSELGLNLSPGYDVDGDGFSDILLGAESASTLTGRAYLFMGSGGW